MLIDALAARTPRPSAGMELVFTSSGFAFRARNSSSGESGGGTPCPFGEIITWKDGTLTKTGIRGGLILCGDQNWNLDPQELNPQTNGVWLVSIGFEVEVNRDDDGELLLPGVKTGTKPTGNWTQTAWSEGTDYPANTAPDGFHRQGQHRPACRQAHHQRRLGAAGTHGLRAIHHQALRRNAFLFTRMIIRTSQDAALVSCCDCLPPACEAPRKECQSLSGAADLAWEIYNSVTHTYYRTTRWDYNDGGFLQWTQSQAFNAVLGGFPVSTAVRNITEGEPKTGGSNSSVSDAIDIEAARTAAIAALESAVEWDNEDFTYGTGCDSWRENRTPVSLLDQVVELELRPLSTRHSGRLQPFNVCGPMG